jgi:hypothetical protein
MLKKVIISVVLVVFLIAAVLVLYKVLNPKNSAVLSQGNYIEASFLAEAIRPEVASGIKVGDTIYDSMGKKCFTVTNVKFEPTQAKYVYYDQNSNSLYLENNSILKDVFITAKSLDKNYAWAYSYGKDQIMAGAHLALYGKNWKLWTIVLTVNETK